VKSGYKTQGSKDYGYTNIKRSAELGGYYITYCEMGHKNPRAHRARSDHIRRAKYKYQNSRDIG
jgi:hypothetical protein